MKKIRLLLIPVFLLIIAGCQSIPKDNSLYSGLEYAKLKYSIFIVTLTDEYNWKDSNVFRSKYTVQDKATMKLPGTHGLYEDFKSHCNSIGGDAKSFDNVTLICQKNNENLYAVNAYNGRDAWLQVIEPTLPELIKDPNRLSFYSRSNFTHWVKKDIGSTVKLLGLKAAAPNL